MSGVPERSLHIDATWLYAHWIMTLASVNKELDALLYEGLMLFSGVFLGRFLLDVIVQSQSELVHWMYVPQVTIASNTKVKVLVREGGSKGGREGRGGSDRKETVTKPFRQQMITIARYQVTQIM